MRMWNTKPSLMCRQHLLGEHLEMHMLVGAIKKGKSIKGFVTTGLVRVIEIQNRHDSLAKEMTNRGYNHKSPLDFDYAQYEYPDGRGFIRATAKQELLDRCKECRKNANRKSRTETQTKVL